MSAEQRPRVVVITGASAGVGRAAAHAFAREGAHIGLIARSRDALQEAAREVVALGGRALVLPCDVADSAAIEAAATTVEESLGPIDVWVNNAMASVFSPIKETPPEEFKRVTEVTYLGFVYGTLAALKRMLPRDRGVIVQVGSALAYRGIPLQAAYCAAKHAIEGFCDSLRCELLHDGSNVRVTMIQMPALNTPQFRWVKSRLPHKAQPVPPIFQPSVAADAILYASHHPRREFIVGWPAFKAVYGNKIAPGIGDRFLANMGYDAQQHDGPEDPNRPNNLWTTVEGKHSTRGDFDQRAKDSSAWWFMSKNRGWFAAAAVALLAIAAGGAARQLDND
ncbi:MAG: SDR family oxidoreductase [Chthoniobacterales bacterium]|nr:SDR family oxidoreductase [Chthoniobacterales bacterium]